MARNPSFNLNIALSNDIEPLSLDELNSKLLYSLRRITESNIDDYGEVLRFKKNFGSFEAFIEIHLDISEDILQDDLEATEDRGAVYKSILILIDIADVKLSNIKEVITRIQAFILDELVHRIKQSLIIYPEVRNEDVTIHFKDAPNMLQSLKGFDIKEILGNYEDFRIKVFKNKLVVSGNIKNGSIEKIDNLIRSNLAN